MHLVEGTTNVTRHKDRGNEPQPTGVPIKPKAVKGRASVIWDQYAEQAYWLTEVDSQKFAVWCKLSALIEKSVDKASAARISQWRGLGSELGFDPSSRSRIDAKKKSPKTKDPAEKYFKPTK